MSGKYELINVYDDIVKSMVKEMIEQEEGMCQCEKCFLDTCALVFNRGYTNFVTTPEGNALMRIEKSSRASRVELTVVIMNVIKMVKSSPRHSD